MGINYDFAVYPCEDAIESLLGGET